MLRPENILLYNYAEVLWVQAQGTGAEVRATEHLSKL